MSIVRPDAAEVAAFQAALLAWFSAHARSFPWRETTDPYRVLVAEMLLQQTDAKKAQAVYQELIHRFPTPEALTAAPLAELEALIAPIGLRYRAARLQGAVRALIAGQLQPDESTLLGVHGVGRYMARALLCFAFGQPVGVLDANVIRILDRVFGIRSPRSRPHTDRALWALVNELVPPDAARAYNLALLDLSAALCRPTKPRCGECPITICRYRHQALAAPAEQKK